MCGSGTSASSATSTWSSKEEVQGFRQGTLHLDCPAVKLERHTPEGERVFSGPGYISQAPDRKITFKLYAKESVPVDEVLGRIFGTAGPKAGEVIPLHEYWELSAVDSHTRRWRSLHVLPEPETHAELEGSIWAGDLDQLSSTADMPEYSGCNFLVLDFPGDHRIPYNTPTSVTATTGETKSRSGYTNTLLFASEGADFQLVREKEDQALVLTARSAASLPDYYETRLTETLQFLLGREMLWTRMESCRERVATVTLRSGDGGLAESGLYPPITDRWSESARWFAEMFVRYLRHVQTYPRENYHPISIQLRAVCRAGAGSLEARTLTLSVAIESILKVAFKDYGRPSKELKAQIAGFRAYLGKWDGPEDPRRRIDGAVGALQQQRAFDQLKELAEKGIVTEEQRDTWKEVRNSAAHASITDSWEIQELLRKYHVLVVLLFHLVFWVIGYRGSHVDHNTPGWPLREYSPVPTVPGQQ